MKHFCVNDVASNDTAYLNIDQRKEITVGIKAGNRTKEGNKKKKHTLKEQQIAD